MKITFLGTGTSTGVPQVGCSCPVCVSSDPRDSRLRTSALVESDSHTRILIDCGPDFRQQMLSRSFRPLDAVLITHEHYDHVGGLDDLRPFSVFGGVDIYAERLCALHLRERLPYCFAENKYPGVPRIELHEVRPGQSFGVKDLEVLPIRVMHGQLPILGFRIGKMAYLTDMTTIADEQLAQLRDISLLVVNGLRHDPHPTHQSIDEAVGLAKKVRAVQTYIVHMSHHAGLHAETSSRLPSNVHLAYDGLTVEF